MLCQLATAACLSCNFSFYFVQREPQTLLAYSPGTVSNKIGLSYSFVTGLWFKSHTHAPPYSSWVQEVVEVDAESSIGGHPTWNGLGNTPGPTREIMLMVEFSQKLVISYRVSNFMSEKGNFESTLLVKYHSTYG
jgi:hypothetical protein